MRSTLLGLLIVASPAVLAQTGNNGAGTENTSAPAEPAATETEETSTTEQPEPSQAPATQDDLESIEVEERIQEPDEAGDISPHIFPSEEQEEDVEEIFPDYRKNKMGGEILCEVW